jgi:hypothetical protein
MIALDQAMTIAEQHVIAQPHLHPDYRLALGPMRNVPAGWYFGYEMRCLRDIPPDEQERFGGAPGFIVHRDDGRVEVIGWGEYH